jgi:hypothetical protein
MIYPGLSIKTLGSEVFIYLDIFSYFVIFGFISLDCGFILQDCLECSQLDLLCWLVLVDFILMNKIEQVSFHMD